MTKDWQITKGGFDRLDLSERVLAGWEEMVALGATPSENLRLVEAELVILARMRDEDPERVEDLISRYRAIRSTLVRSHH